MPLELQVHFCIIINTHSAANRSERVSGRAGCREASGIRRARVPSTSAVSDQVERRRLGALLNAAPHFPRAVEYCVTATKLTFLSQVYYSSGRDYHGPRLKAFDFIASLAAATQYSTALEKCGAALSKAPSLRRWN